MEVAAEHPIVLFSIMILMFRIFFFLPVNQNHHRGRTAAAAAAAAVALNNVGQSPAEGVDLMRRHSRTTSSAGGN